VTTHRPISLTETLTVGSIEGFLTSDEVAGLTALMDQFLHETDTGPGATSPYDRHRTSSIHEIPGHGTDVAMAIYEPAGRVEITAIPTAAEELLQAAFRRAHQHIGRVVPSVTACRPWTYIEYGPGQHITPHIDGIAPDPRSWPRQIAGISVAIAIACTGGEFFVETTGADRLWNPALTCSAPGYGDAMAFAHDAADNSSPWFSAMPRTRWSATPGRGAALLYGSQLTHGTTPVRDGRSRKFISWLFAELP